MEQPGLQIVGSPGFAAQLLALLDQCPSYNTDWILSGVNLGSQAKLLAQALQKSNAALILCEGALLAQLHPTERQTLEGQLQKGAIFLVCWNPPRAFCQDWAAYPTTLFYTGEPEASLLEQTLQYCLEVCYA